jgi:hypothetical protein
MDSNHKIYVVNQFGHDYTIPQYVIGPPTDDFEGMCNRLITVAAERLVDQSGNHEWGCIDTDALISEMVPLLAKEGYLPIGIEEVGYSGHFDFDSYLPEETLKKVLAANKRTSNRQDERRKRHTPEWYAENSAVSEDESYRKHMCRGCHGKVAGCEGDIECKRCADMPLDSAGKKMHAWLCDKCIHELSGITLCIHCLNYILQETSTKEYYR